MNFAPWLYELTVTTITTVTNQEPVQDCGVTVENQTVTTVTNPHQNYRNQVTEVTEVTVDSENKNFDIQFQEQWGRFEVREKDNPNLPYWVYLSKQGNRCHCKEWQGQKHCKHIEAVLKWKEHAMNG